LGTILGTRLGTGPGIMAITCREKKEKGTSWLEQIWRTPCKGASGRRVLETGIKPPENRVSRRVSKLG
jgi:hypothetical protein